jgi:hypothetical protein
VPQPLSDSDLADLRQGMGATGATLGEMAGGQLGLGPMGEVAGQKVFGAVGADLADVVNNMYYSGQEVGSAAKGAYDWAGAQGGTDPLHGNLPPGGAPASPTPGGAPANPADPGGVGQSGGFHGPGPTSGGNDGGFSGAPPTPTQPQAPFPAGGHSGGNDGGYSGAPPTPAQPQGPFPTGGHSGGNDGGYSGAPPTQG